MQFVLNEETSKHVVQVLRMNKGEQLQLTDGEGNLYIAEIIDDNRKKCELKILSCSNQPVTSKKVTIAISPVKNNARFEWFLEKATEIGVREIVPLLCTRTEKQHFRHDRMKSILVSAMLQSQQCWLPLLKDPIKFDNFVKQPIKGQKFIAHCEDESNKVRLSPSIINKEMGKLILIGPEGDFTSAEIVIAIQNNFVPVTLGENRLRTETAGVVAVVLLSLVG